MLQKSILAVLSLLSLSIPTFAQESIGDLDFSETKTIYRGWRFGLIRAETEKTIRYYNEYSSMDPYYARVKVPYSGFGASFANLPINEIGFAGGVSLLFAETIRPDTVLRGDLNIASAFNNYISAKMGGNMSYSTDATSSGRTTGFGIGYNVGLGLKMNRVFSAELNYVSLGQLSSAAGGTESAPQQGFEAQLLATF